jgi:hypothetical protein
MFFGTGMFGVRYPTRMPPLHRSCLWLLAVALTGAGCAGAPSGRLFFEGTNDRGHYSSSLSPTDCAAKVSRDASGAWHLGTVTFFAGGAVNYVSLAPGGAVSVSVVEPPVQVALEAQTCQAYDVRTWIDAARAVHAVVDVDCNLPGGAQLRGRMASDNCLPLQN